MRDEATVASLRIDPTVPRYWTRHRMSQNKKTVEAFCSFGLDIEGGNRKPFRPDVERH